MIDFHTWDTPNGHKVRIMLEECGLDYRIHPIDLSKGDQFTPEFLNAGQLNSDTIRSGDILGLRIWENVDDGLLARAGAGDARRPTRADRGRRPRRALRGPRDLS